MDRQSEVGTEQEGKPSVVSGPLALIPSVEGVPMLKLITPLLVSYIFLVFPTIGKAATWKGEVQVGAKNVQVSVFWDGGDTCILNLFPPIDKISDCTVSDVSPGVFNFHSQDPDAQWTGTISRDGRKIKGRFDAKLPISGGSESRSGGFSLKRIESSASSGGSTRSTLLSGLSQPSRPVSPPLQQKLMLFGGSDHKTYLGCVTCSEYETDSIFNSYGQYGSKYSATSITNHYDEFGSPYSPTSACNKYATDPPVVVDGQGNYYGRLTLNAYSQPVQNPRLIGWLAGICQP
jgi:hypothetical protein